MLASKLRRPSPALVISLLALFIALGGSAYAANQLAKNSVGAKQLKKNAVTAAKIKKNAVTTPKIKNNAITGAKINEGSLGPVPSATNATNATNAVNATNFSRFFTTGIRKVGLNETVELAKAGPFTFWASCKDKGAGNYEARTYATTSAPGALISSYTDSEWQEFDFKPGEEAELGEYANDDSTYWSWDEYSYDAEWTAIDAAGTMVLYGVAANGVHVFGSACAFNLSYSNAG